MTTQPLFQQDAYLRSCEAQVLECQDGAIVLDRTVFYPLGGGQPGDSGWLRLRAGISVRITDTRKADQGRIVHVPESAPAGLKVGDTVTAEIDWDRRYAHMRMHTALHLLGAILKFGVTGGQIAADRSRLDFDTQDEIDRERVNVSLNELIRADTTSELGVDHGRGARPPAGIDPHDVGPPAGRRRPGPPAQHSRYRPAALWRHSRRTHR